MSDLSIRALGVTALPKAAVEDVYATTNSLTAKSLCLSHERLRAELQGAEILLGERDHLFEELVDWLERCVTDTGKDVCIDHGIALLAKVEALKSS